MNKSKDIKCGECIHFEGDGLENYCPWKSTSTVPESPGCGEGELLPVEERIGQAIRETFDTLGRANRTIQELIDRSLRRQIGL